MYIVIVDYSRGHKDWWFEEEFESFEEAEKAANEVLEDPFRSDDLYSINICNYKGKILKRIYHRYITI